MGQHDNAHVRTGNDKIGYNNRKTDKNRNDNKRNGNDKQNGYNYIPNTVNNNGGNGHHRNRFNGNLGYDTSESYQYREPKGHVSGIQQDGEDGLQQLSLNSQNMLNQKTNHESNHLPTSEISESSLDNHVDSIFRHGEGKDENYQSGTIYGKAEIGHETNQTSYINQNSNGIDKKDEEYTDECSDQEFR